MSLPNYRAPSLGSYPSSRYRPLGVTSGSTPFITSSHGHPAFNPVKGSGSKSSSVRNTVMIDRKIFQDSRIPKPPKAPDKPLMPYMRYSRKIWDQVKASNPELKLWEIGKIIGQMWRELPESEKQEYMDEYDAEKTQYAENMKAYQHSPAYQAWVAAKGKLLEVMEEEEEQRRGRGSKQQQQESRISIQPADDDDDNDEGFSVKHISASRYHRNHRLINEIFSESCVPDVRTVVTTSRLDVLRKQVQSLQKHQKKLEDELQDIEEKHETKKRKFVDSSEEFHGELKKLCSNKPEITDAMFKNMVLKARDDLLLRQQQMIKERQELLAKQAEEEKQRAAEEEERRRKLEEEEQQRMKEENEKKEKEASESKPSEDTAPIDGDTVVKNESAEQPMDTQDETVATVNEPSPTQHTDSTTTATTAPPTGEQPVKSESKSEEGSTDSKPAADGTEQSSPATTAPAPAEPMEVSEPPVAAAAAAAPAVQQTAPPVTDEPPLKTDQQSIEPVAPPSNNENPTAPGGGDA
ncbi:uncharacterized protein LOC141906686 [Tubulanus polymorphus]|uniref:uncharacterized protein LOC141906686 n=1 Tax=Tubulanus polymorphus TaxID=672921 RepID=UPI003DA55D13